MKPEDKNTKNQPSLPAVHPATELLSKPELARRLRRSPRSIEMWMRRGIIPYYKIERAVLFSWPDVQQTLNRRFRITCD